MPGITPLKGFKLRDAQWQTDWGQLMMSCPDLSPWGAHILSDGLKHSAKSVVLESNYICKDYRNLYSNYYSKKFTPRPVDTNRLHFFSCPEVAIPELLLYPVDYRNHYLGYSVITPVKERCLGRTIVNPYRLVNANSSNSFYLTTQFGSHINGVHFNVSGYPYIAQDRDVIVCAHSALWGVCRYLSERYPIYAEKYPFDLIQLTEHSMGRTYPLRGMYYADYSHILSAFGAYPIIIKMKETVTSAEYIPSAFEDLYTYVESGFPVLASFPNHVVSIVGHTIDYNKPVTPDAHNLIDSSAFVKQFIVVDDNFFPYKLLGSDEDPDNYGNPYQVNINSLKTAVCPLPEKVFLSSEKARSRSLDYLKAYRPQIENLGSGPYVTRLFITTGTAWKRKILDNITRIRPVDDLSFLISNINLPHFIWVLEVSPIDSYKKRMCAAVIVLDSTASEIEESLIYMRVGNMLIFRQVQREFLSSPRHFAQFANNLSERE